MSILWLNILDFYDFKPILIIFALLKAAEGLPTCLVHLYYFAEYFFD